LIDTLNLLLADELTATNQYILHSEMCAFCGYEKLHDEEEHIDWLEAQRDQIQQVGLANYLAQQI